MKDTCTVINKSSGRVGYSIPEDGIRREFYPHEIKKNIKVSELEKLLQQPRGMELFYNYLFVEDKEIVYFLLNSQVPPEYWFTKEFLTTWMNNCSLPEFQDALDFAPAGTIDLIKRMAVEMNLNDHSKRQAIKDQLGFDVTKAIDNGGEEDEKAAAAPVQQTGRRVPITQEAAPAEEASKPGRRVVVQSN